MLGRDLPTTAGRLRASMRSLCHGIYECRVKCSKLQIFQDFSNFCNFAWLEVGTKPPAVRSTTREPFSAAAFAILPRFEASMKTVLTASCVQGIGGEDMLRKKGSVIQFVKKSADDCLYFFFCERRDFVRDGLDEGARYKVPEPWVTDSRR
jgi:hypothetical protein